MTTGKRRKYNMACRSGEGEVMEPVETWGQLLQFTIWDAFFFIHRPSYEVHDVWAISEFSTGCRVCVGWTKKDAFEKFKSKMIPEKENSFRAEIKKVIKKYGTINTLPNEPK